MARIDVLLGDFAREARTTRRHLERLPDERFDWRPHPKSFTGGELAGHLVECLRWAERVFVADAFDFSPATYERVRANTVAEVLAAFDAAVEAALQAMANTADRDAEQRWRMSRDGVVFFERDREAAFRDLSLNHLIHHRGQFTVYLRLLDVPLVGTYGPTADERR